MKKIIKINKSFFKPFKFKILPNIKSVKDCPVCQIERMAEAQELLNILYNQSLDNLKFKINKPYGKCRIKNN